MLLRVIYISVGERWCQRGADEEVVIGMECLLYCIGESILTSLLLHNNEHNSL